MSVSNLPAFVLASVVLIAVPGPSVLFIVGRALALGRGAAVLSAVGNAAGVLLLACVVAVGLGPLLQQSEPLLHAVKIVGALYLVVLGVRALRSANRLPARAATGRSPRARSRARTFREGLVVGLLNPKALVFLAAALPQFVQPAAGPVPPQLLLLGAIFVALSLAIDCAWAVFAGSARAWVATDARRLRGTTRTGGIVMVGLGGTLGVAAVQS